MKKKGIEFGFAWIFAIIVGAAIIIFAIYASSNIIKSERKVQDSESGKQLGIILNPIETGLESGKSAKIGFSQESRIYNSCESGGFGLQKIGFESRAGVGEKWQGSGANSSYNNKYIFSDKIVQGNEVTVFSKSFEMPYKVSDLIFIWSEDYCFVNPPREIENEVKELGLSINISSSISECKEGSRKVCFSSVGVTDSRCNIEVSLNGKSVTKNGKTSYYEDSLIYGAIFAEKELYECHVKRISYRASLLSQLYIKKISFNSVNTQECGENIVPLLSIYSNITILENSYGLKEMKVFAEEIRRKNNEITACKIF